MIDGASVPAGLASGCGHGTAWFARQLGTQLLALLTTQADDHRPADSLAQAITDVAALHADTCDLGHPGSPSATEQRRHRNHPDGFWVASTDPDAAQHALTDTVARHRLRRAAVLSDGATRLVDRFGLLDWPSLLGILAEQGPDALLQQVRAAEDSDPEGRRWPRGKRHDDASAASCHLI